MGTGRILAAEALERFRKANAALVHDLFEGERKNFNCKIIVLDDDPTGIQTVHGVSVYTDWSRESISAGFSEKNPMFFILTNSRGMTVEETVSVHREISRNILEVSKASGINFMIISRSDSTLRGHYPVETQTMKEYIEPVTGQEFDGEIILPFFKEGGRFTLDNIHYVQEGEYLIPAGETEFAKDKTFGYANSHLGKWVEEKSEGKYSWRDTTYITLESIRSMDLDGIVSQLKAVSGFNKVIVNAIDYSDVEAFSTCLIRAIKSGKRYMFRTAAAFTKVIGGVGDKALLKRYDLIKGESCSGGLIVIGSHVNKTTEQLNELKTLSFVEFVEFNQHLVLEENMLEAETDRVVEICNKLIPEGKTVAVYTRRQRLDLNVGNKEEELKISVKISDAVTSIVKKINVRPNYIIAKGGITSSDIGTKGLGVKKATVAGQISHGIPVWLTGEESRFPGMPYIIFPGNVGSKTTLMEAVNELEGKRNS